MIGIIQIIDARHKPSDDDKMMVDWLKSSGLNFLIAATKADKISNNKKAKQRKLIFKEIDLYPDDNFIFFSAKTGEGSREVLDYIDFLLDFKRN